MLLFPSVTLNSDLWPRPAILTFLNMYVLCIYLLSEHNRDQHTRTADRVSTKGEPFLFNFGGNWGPYRIFGTGDARHFKLAVQIDRGDYEHIHDRLPPKSNWLIHNSSLDTFHSVRNLGFIFDEHLTFSDQMTSLSKACYYHIFRQLRCIWPYIDSSTACTIATFIVHSKLDYCNSL